jgi:hypothetical protein
LIAKQENYLKDKVEFTLMVRRTASFELTNQQILALDFLSMDCGITNQELTELLGKKNVKGGTSIMM